MENKLNSTTTSTTAMNSATVLMTDAQIEYLFHSPQDLICPITRQLFIDPIVNSAGQIYEREAFLEYIEKQEEKLDPITRKILNPSVLTPIYNIKNRAFDYREKVANICIDLACQKDCKDPMIFLKRAAELCIDVEIQIPGLSNSLIKDILRHAGNSGCNVPILMSFGEELMEDGQRERAASIYYNLLKFGDDKTCQPDVLKRCIECWVGSVNETEKYSFDKLLDFIETQDVFTWEHIIEIMQRGEINDKICLRVCEELLVRSIEKNSNDNLWIQHQGVLLRYISIKYQHLSRQQGVAQKDIERLQEWKERVVRSGNSSLYRQRSIPFSVIKERRKPFFLKKKFIGCALLGALTMLEESANKGIKIGKAFAFFLIAYAL